MTKTVVLATNGSLGDLFPVLALAKALARRDVTPVIASNKDHMATIRAAGFEGHAVFASVPEMAAQRGEETPVFMRKFAQNPPILFDYLLDSADEAARRFTALADRADLVVANQLALGAHLGAELTQTPSVMMIYQPIGLIAWQLLDRDRMKSVRQSLGLQTKPGNEQLDFSPWLQMILAMYSPVMGKNTPQLPWPIRITGFPVWTDPAGKTMDTETQAFLDAGPPPLVVTLGSFLPDMAIRIYGEAARLADLLDRRAVVLGAGDLTEPGPNVHVAGYVAHPPLFARAAAIVHHGGIGTAAAALRSGKPQLIVPHVADAWNNAERIDRLGVSASLNLHEFSAESARPLLKNLLEDAHVAKRTRQVARRLRDETGAETAAGALLELL